jgi:hypothetical protein
MKIVTPWNTQIIIEKHGSHDQKTHNPKKGGGVKLGTFGKAFQKKTGINLATAMGNAYDETVENTYADYDSPAMDQANDYTQEVMADRKAGILKKGLAELEKGSKEYTTGGKLNDDFEATYPSKKDKEDFAKETVSEFLYHEDITGQATSIRDKAADDIYSDITYGHPLGGYQTPEAGIYY